MKQKKLDEVTRKAIEAPLGVTRSMMELSKKLRNPSPKGNKIGMTIGGCIGVGLLLVGMVQMLIGKPLWAFGTLAAGAATMISRLICHDRK